MRLTADMMNSEAFLKLSTSAIALYIQMKLWAGGQQEFKYAASLAERFMTKPTFIKCKRELADAGFIDEVNKNGAQYKREVALIKLSDKWRNK
jgi:hypothetical protein